MPGIAVSLNGKQLVAVATEGLNILSLRVHGDVISSEFATIEVDGGYYGDEPDKQNNRHLIWVSEIEIAPDDEVAIEFLESVLTSDRGKTIEELYPEHEVQTEPILSLEEMFRELAMKPKARERFAFQVMLPSGEVVKSQTDMRDHSFSFTLLWDWTRPETAGISLSSNSLEGIEKRENGTEHARFRLQYAQRVKLRVSA